MVYLPSSLPSPGTFRPWEGNGVTGRKISFIFSISKGSLCSSYPTEIIYRFYFPDPTVFIIIFFLTMRSIKANVKNTVEEKQIAQIFKIYLKEKWMLCEGHVHPLCWVEEAGFYFWVFLDAYWQLNIYIGGDITISSIHNFPKML